MANIEIISGDKVTFHKNTVIPWYRQKVERAGRQKSRSLSGVYTYG